MEEDKNNRTLDDLITTFQEYLRRTRGMHPAERRRYAKYVQAFLEQAICAAESVDVSTLVASDVIAFILTLVGQYHPNTIRKYSSALRIFFRFLRLEGLREDRLDDVVPSAVKRRLSGLPRHLESEQLDYLISSLDRSSPRARRDRAIILCIARLGLRASEVMRMRLEDIDWRAAVVHVPTRKSGRGALLPLPADVGGAIVEYLNNGRPITKSRNVFVVHQLPRIGKSVSYNVVYDAVKIALDRARIEAPIHGANLLRHTLATRLIRNGSSLKEIADLMGHRCLETTQIYAKVDLNSLRGVAQPWPEVKS